MVFGLALERISEGVECVSNILCLNLRVKFGETVPFFKLAERTRVPEKRNVLQAVRKMTRC